jgi:hypothetical protein
MPTGAFGRFIQRPFRLHATASALSELCSSSIRRFGVPVRAIQILPNLIGTDGDLPSGSAES